MAAAGGTLLICAFLIMSPLLLYGDETIANIYNVGDDAGWTGGINWPHPGQLFLAGGVLMFKYPPGEHNVVRVDADGYDTCTVPTNPEVHRSGRDFIMLDPGDNYFICGFKGHCSDAGMKIVVTTE